MRLFWTLLICAAGLAAEDLNRPMQRFQLPDTTGRDHDSIDWKGKPMVIEFMATACPHCIAFSSVLKQVQEKYKDRVVVLAMVNPPTTPAQAAQFVQDHKITYPILLDAGKAAYAYIRKLEFNLPYVFLIDSSGMIREAFEFGPTTADLFYGNALLSHIDSLFVPPAAQKK